MTFTPSLGKRTVPFDICETNGYDFIYKQLGEDFQREDVMEQFPGARTFPQIIVNDENIGGYTELEGLHKGGQL